MFVCENEKATDIIFTEKQDAEVFLSALCGFFLVDRGFQRAHFWENRIMFGKLQPV